MMMMTTMISNHRHFCVVDSSSSVSSSIVVDVVIMEVIFLTWCCFFVFYIPKIGNLYKNTQNDHRRVRFVLGTPPPPTWNPPPPPPSSSSSSTKTLFLDQDLGQTICYCATGWANKDNLPKTHEYLVFKDSDIFGLTLHNPQMPLPPPLLPRSLGK